MTLPKLSPLSVSAVLLSAGLAFAQMPTTPASLDKAKTAVKAEVAETKVETTTTTTETTKKVDAAGSKIRTTAKTEGKKVVKKGTEKAVEKVPVAGQAAPALESAGGAGVDKGVDYAADKAKLNK